MSAAGEAGIHPSRKMEKDWDVPDPHCPAWKRTTCEEMACLACRLEDDDPLAVTCLGFSWFDGVTVTGGDGIQRRVRESGTGWPK